MQKRKLVSMRALQPGMKIGQAVLDQTGRELIARGALLDDFQIEYLQDKVGGGIYIVEGEPDPEELLGITLSDTAKKVVEENRKEDRSKVMLNESIRKRVGEGIQYLFNDTDNESFTETTNNISDDLMNTIMQNDAVAVDVSMLKVSDEYTFKHSVDVATIAMVIAKKYGLSRQEIHEIGTAGLLHDVGKSQVPLEVLNKPGRLSDQEFNVMKQHTTFGYWILEEKHQFSRGIMEGVLQHHEKAHGNGYPNGLTADRIHLYAKIISVADIYDALVTDRPYKKAFSKRTAMEMVMANAEDLDLKAMQCFISSVILFPVDTIVNLSNGEMAKVVSNDPNYPMRPTVVGVESGRLYDLSHDLGVANVIIL